MNLDRLIKPLWIVLAAVGFSHYAYAEDSEIEEVVVTGSLIKGTPEDDPLPVTTVQREDLRLEGSPSSIDMIRNMSFSQGADGETDQFQAGAGADRATINIRGLGPSRSLVLVNGRRTTWSPGAIGAQAQLLVDVNMMPAMALSRIEVLRDGAAATYGSDAIAGVMNYITRSDFVGFEVSAGHKTIEDTDGEQDFGFIWGGELMDGRLNIVTSGAFHKRDQLRISDREEWSLLPFAESVRGGWSSVGRPSVVVPLDRWNGPVGQAVRAAAGGFAGLLATGIVDPNCEALGGAVTSSGVAGNAGGGFCRFQYTAFDNLIENAERWQWFTEATFQISDTTTLSAELLLTDSDVPDWGTSPSYPPNRLVDESRTIRANNPGLIDMASKYPDIYGAYASCDEAYCGWAGDGGAQDAAGIPIDWQEVAWFYGRTYGQDGPPRSHLRHSELMRFAAALDGEWGDYFWQTSVSYSKSERQSAGGDTMVYRDIRARQGLGGAECEASVPNEYDANGNLVFSLETLQAHAGQGPCQYWIPFSNSMAGSNELVLGGPNSNPDFNPALDNQALRDYMITEGVGGGETSLLVIEAILSGELGLELGGGNVGFALGAQIRSETYETGVAEDDFFNGVVFPCQAGPDVKDCETGRTGLFGFLPPSFPIDADRDIYSVFTELSLPFSEQLEGQFSMRYEDYGGATGASLDPKLALRFQATDSIRFRVSAGTTFRGPTLNQTVDSNSSNSLQYVGVTGAFKRIDTVGNPNLDPEEATTINAGLLVDHDGLFGAGDNLFMTLDYWSYDFTDPLVTEPFNNVLALACPGAASDPCDESSPYFDRMQFGGDPRATDVEIITVNIVNGPDIKTDGIDFTLRYGFDAGPGYLTMDLSGTQILSYDIDAWTFGGAYDALGRLNYRTSLARTLAEFKGRLTTNYAWGDVNARWVVNYLDEYTYLDQDNTDGTVDSHLTHDLHVNYSMMDGKLDLIASVINVGDENPPFMSREMNYDALSHNPFGRMVRVGFQYRLAD